MNGRIVHVFRRGLHLRVRNSQLEVLEDRECLDRIPVEDLCAVVVATAQLTLSARFIAELSGNNVPLLVCDESFLPVSVCAPYFEPVNTDTVRSQLDCSEHLGREIWKKIIDAKVENQIICLKGIDADSKAVKAAAQAADTVEQKEAQAAKQYWPEYLQASGSIFLERVKQSRKGVNGRLDYGYAVIRAMVLRSLAGSGLIAAIGHGHKIREHHFALADDMMEPFRPFLDFVQWEFSMSGEDDHRLWARAAARLLGRKLKHKGRKVSLEQAVTECCQSLAVAYKEKTTEKLEFPKLNDLEQFA